MNQQLQRGITLLLLIAICISIFSLPTLAAEIPVDYPMYGTVYGSDAYGGLKIREQASASSTKLGAYSDGTVVELLSKSGNWYQIPYNGKTANISANYVKLGCTGTVTASSLNKRTGPGTDYAIDGSLSKNSTVIILSKVNDNWYKAWDNSKICYLSTKYVKISGGNVASNNNSGKKESDSHDNTSVGYTTGTVTASGLNVRSGPGTSYTVIGGYQKSAEVTICAMEGDWYKIIYGTGYAYVSAKHVKVNVESKIEESAPATRTGYVSGDYVNVREGAGVAYKDIGDVYFGTPLTIVDEKKGWYKITYQDDFAWVSASYVETDPKALCGMAMVKGADIVYAYYSRSATSGNISTRVINGAIIKVLYSYSNGWAKVLANGRECFIKKQYLNFLSYEDYFNLPKEEAKKGNTIASYSYSFAGKDKNAIKNIKSGASFVNGTIVFPGETFDYYRITHPKGFLYEEAPVIIGGEYSTSRGGGLCFLSSTIYGAIQSTEDSGIDTGLNVTARFSHSKNPGYVYEAAISSYYQTFAFCNTNTYPVKVVAEINGNTLTIKIIKV